MIIITLQQFPFEIRIQKFISQIICCTIKRNKKKNRKQEIKRNEKSVWVSLKICSRSEMYKTCVLNCL